jgi:glutathione transport system permease protein
MLLMQVFSVELGWLPTVGADSWRHYILPSLTLGAAVAAVMARFTRASFVDVLHEDYMRTARAKGVSETRVVLKHGLRNAMIPVVTMMGLQFGFPARRLDRRGEGLQLAGAGASAGRFGGDARLPGDSGGSPALFAGVYSYQFSGGCAVRRH